MTNSTNNGFHDRLTSERTSAAFALPAPSIRHDGAAHQSPRDPLPGMPVVKPWKTRWVASLAVVFALALAGMFAAATMPRIHNEQALAASAEMVAKARPRLTVETARRGAAGSERELPGSAQAFLDAAVYGRTNGYLKRRLVDIGDRVQSGQLLAEIAAPELDAQLEQAKATLLQSKANLLKLQAEEVFARAEEERYRPLLTKGAATQEAYEQKLAIWKADSAAVAAMEATIKVNEADIQRLTALQSFERLTAPFSGVVTVRNVDPGDLITADNPSTERLLFRVAQIDPLRVFVDVPQVFATDVKPGQTAALYRREDPSQQYAGTVTRTANALDPNTRTLRTEVDVPNPRGELLPGMYLQVKFLFDRKHAPVLIPTAAVIVRSGAPRVAVVDDQNAVHYQEVKLGRDFGAEVEVMTGLRAGQRVGVYPGDDLPDGTVVEPASASTK